MRIFHYPSLFNSVVPLPAVRRMDIFDEQMTTMRVRWEPVPGATGYRLLYNALNATEPTVEQEVSADFTLFQKYNLILVGIF